MRSRVPLLFLFLSQSCSSQAPSSSGGVCLDPGIGILCANFSTSEGNITFSVSCGPPAGMSPGQTFWCGFGLSHASVGDMFPAEATIIQYTPERMYLEDRDSFVGYRSPPCYRAQVSQLLSARSEGGTLFATWTRPLLLPRALTDAHYVNISQGETGAMTLIGASSTDTAPAASPCQPEMQTHTYCAMGQRIVF